MRKILSAALALVLIFTSAACGSNNSGDSTPDEAESNGNHSTNERAGNPNEAQEENSPMIKLTFDNEEVIVNIYDNPTGRDFLTMLPITLSFEDYVGKEKISYLPRKLDTEPAPSHSGSSVGEFAYYAPWGNLAIFYNGPATTANGLIVLGEIESGMDKLASMSDDFTVTIEKMD